jgi:hypothetical protein
LPSTAPTYFGVEFSMKPRAWEAPRLLSGGCHNQDPHNEKVVVVATPDFAFGAEFLNRQAIKDKIRELF